MTKERMLQIAEKVTEATGIPVLDTGITESVRIAKEKEFPIFLQIRTSWIELFVSWHGTSSSYDVPITIMGNSKKLICHHHASSRQFSDYDKLLNHIIRYIKDQQAKFSNRDY